MPETNEPEGWDLVSPGLFTILLAKKEKVL
jgi:hypothetical protein